MILMLLLAGHEVEATAGMFIAILWLRMALSDAARSLSAPDTF